MKPKFKVGDLLWDKLHGRLHVLKKLPTADKTFNSGWKICGIDSSYFRRATTDDVHVTFTRLAEIVQSMVKKMKDEARLPKRCIQAARKKLDREGKLDTNRLTGKLTEESMLKILFLAAAYHLGHKEMER